MLDKVIKSVVYTKATAQLAEEIEGELKIPDNDKVLDDEVKQVEEEQEKEDND